jgi:hypothetical protein
VYIERGKCIYRRTGFGGEEGAGGVLKRLSRKGDEVPGRDENLDWAIEVVTSDPNGESVGQALAALRDEGLIQPSGTCRRERPSYVLTDKGRRLLAQLT